MHRLGDRFLSEFRSPLSEMYFPLDDPESKLLVGCFSNNFMKTQVVFKKERRKKKKAAAMHFPGTNDGYRPHSVVSNTDQKRKKKIKERGREMSTQTTLF